MQSVSLSILSLIAVMSSPIAAANTLDKEEWSADLRQEFTTMRHEAVANIEKMNRDAIDKRDERFVKHIKEQQAQLVKIQCKKTEATNSSRQITKVSC
ncbi:hypothetical protein [Vibrio sp. AND4]|uniref:hypothetical protein n=1 Tax=Vibrio sp. AND4 TaxID=314289 RepID=UPI00015F33FD|nr:hypothetical protein [Vibrio sp. AND4]EDP59625.1 hypothetical protein AND4_10724 [Vibrio sp. AND4]